MILTVVKCSKMSFVRSIDQIRVDQSTVSLYEDGPLGYGEKAWLNAHVRVVDLECWLRNEYTILCRAAGVHKNVYLTC